MSDGADPVRVRFVVDGHPALAERQIRGVDFAQGRVREINFPFQLFAVTGFAASKLENMFPVGQFGCTGWDGHSFGWDFVNPVQARFAGKIHPADSQNQQGQECSAQNAKPLKYFFHRCNLRRLKLGA